MADQDAEALEAHIELVRYMATSLLGKDVAVEVSGVTQQDQLRIDLHVPEKVRGRVIGKGGRIARAMRNVADAAAIATHRNVVIEIVD